MGSTEGVGGDRIVVLVLSHSQPRQVLACIRNSAGVRFLANVALTHSNLGATSNGKGECMLMLGCAN